MLPYINLFGLALPVAPLATLAGAWIGLSLVEKKASFNQLDAETLYNLAFGALIAGLIGARLGYAARYPQAFIENPASLISRNLGLFDLSSGMLVALITAIIYGQRKGLPFWRTLDAFTPGLAVMGIAVAGAQAAAGSAYGAESSLPWAISMWGAERHPSQLYALLAAGLILWAVWPGRLKRELFEGEAFLVFTALTAGARLFLEAFRGDSLVTAGNVRIAQIWAWLALSIALWLLNQRRHTADSN